LFLNIHNSKPFSKTSLFTIWAAFNSRVEPLGIKNLAELPLSLIPLLISLANFLRNLSLFLASALSNSPKRLNPKTTLSPLSLYS